MSNAFAAPTRISPTGRLVRHAPQMQHLRHNTTEYRRVRDAFRIDRTGTANLSEDLPQSGSTQEC